MVHVTQSSVGDGLLTADLDTMGATLADRVGREKSAAIIVQAIEAIITSRQALKWMQSGPSPEMICHSDPAAIQSWLEDTQRLVVQADEQVARSRATSPQAGAWIAWFEAALDDRGSA
jgi:hypothetical protein